MGISESCKTCSICGTPNNIANERCKKCDAYLLEGLQSGNITIDNKSIQRFRRLNKGPDVICPVCKTHNKAIAKNCVQCGAWLLDEYWKPSKANDGYSHILPFRPKRATSISQDDDRPFSQTNWVGWMVAFFIIFFVIGKMLPTDNSSKYPEASLPAINNVQPNQNLKLVDLPPNGDTFYYKNAEAIAPFCIRTEPDVNYFIKLIDTETGNTAVTVFVWGGQSVDIKVPLGTYEFRYASGKNWYGEDHLFGSGTVYMRADKKFSFYMNGQQIEGHTVGLIKQMNGNLPTQNISKSEF